MQMLLENRAKSTEISIISDKSRRVRTPTDLEKKNACPVGKSRIEYSLTLDYINKIKSMVHTAQTDKEMVTG